MILRRGGRIYPLLPRLILYELIQDRLKFCIKVLGWAPRVPLEKGLTVTIDYFRKELKKSDNKEKDNGLATAYVL